MNPKNIPFTIIDWATIKPSQHAGDTGEAFWRTLQFAGLRVRVVEYTAGYFADHWCQKGHIVYCLEGEFITEQGDGQRFTLKQGMSYIVTDDLSSHRSSTTQPVKLLIIDGDFLKFNAAE